MSTIYNAFLRGINVGSHTIIKMEELRKAFESLGYTNVKTILNSGNVRFETTKTPAAKEISAMLKKTFGYIIPVLIRTNSEMQSLIEANPFHNIKITPLTRLYVTFLSDESKTTHTLSHTSPDVEIVRVSSKEVCSAITLSSKMGTTELMKILEKEFGKNITTRNWNTIMKMGKM